MRTTKMFMLGCVVVLLVAGVISFPETAFGLEIVVGCAGPPSVTGVAAVTITTADGRQWPINTPCNGDGSRRASTEIPGVMGWSATLMVGKSGTPTMSECGPFIDEPLPARFTCKHDTENVRLHVTVK